MEGQLHIPSPIEEIKHHPGNSQGIRIFMKRDDLIHPEVSGNKWRKLKYNLEAAKNAHCSTIVTAGGPWSNHLAATAAAGKHLGFTTRAFIRGHEPATWSDTLKFCHQQGMKFRFLSKSEFDSFNFAQHISSHEYWIPIGGSNDLGVKGCEDVIKELEQQQYDMICLSFGTGTTMMGIGNACPDKNILGFSALGDPKHDSIVLNDWIRVNNHVWANYDYGFGGFAKTTPELEDFIIRFHQDNKIILDPVYTGKMMFGLYNLIEKRQISENQHIIAIHTGGLQGIKGFPDLHKQLFTS